MDQSFVDIGQRLAELRARRGMTQQELHEASGVGLRVIQNIEQGRTARMESYHALARVFGLETLVFVPRSAGATRYVEMDDSEDLALAGWRSAIAPAMGLDGPLYGDLPDKPDLPALTRGMHSVVEAYQRTQYDQVSRLAPALIRSAHLHVESVPDSQRMDAVEVRCELLHLAGQYLKQVRHMDLALLAYSAAIQDAKTLSNQELAATMIAGHSFALIRQGRFQEVEQVCLLTAKQIEPSLSSSDNRELGTWGRLLFVAACAAARNNRPAEAGEYMSMSGAAATRIGSDILLHGSVAFGPIAVKMKLAEVKLLGGHPDVALELWKDMPRHDTVNPVGYRRGRLDHAHSLALTGDPDKAADVLDELRVAAPEWLVHQRFARDILREVLRGRKRSYTEQQRGLIGFLGLENETDT